MGYPSTNPQTRCHSAGKHTLVNLDLDRTESRGLITAIAIRHRSMRSRMEFQRLTAPYFGGEEKEKRLGEICFPCLGSAIRPHRVWTTIAPGADACSGCPAGIMRRSYSQQVSFARLPGLPDLSKKAGPASVFIARCRSAFSLWSFASKGSLRKGYAMLPPRRLPPASGIRAEAQ
jgi:hypothetical protein